VAVADDEVSAVVKLVVGVVEVRRRNKIVDRRHFQNSVFEDSKKFLKAPLSSVKPNLEVSTTIYFLRNLRTGTIS
jgi:hypothetical protein